MSENRKKWAVNGDLSIHDDADFAQLNQLFKKISSKYGVSDVISSLLKKEVLVPISIFSDKLSSLETVCKYLRENLKLSNKKCADLLNRSEKTIWQAYKKAEASDSLKVEFSLGTFPLRVLCDRKFSVLEAIVRYLKEEKGLSLHKIAVLLHRDDRTIWTVYSRAKKKDAKN